MIIPICKFESIEDKFNFGRYRGLSLADVMDINPSYLDWCVKHCTGVIVQLQDEVIAEIKIVYPDFTMDALFDLKRINKLNRFEFEDSDDLRDDRCRNRGHSVYDDSQTYERYFGTWAQDVEGYSDDDIDTIFDGDPDAYWNID